MLSINYYYIPRRGTHELCELRYGFESSVKACFMRKEGFEMTILSLNFEEIAPNILSSPRPLPKITYP
jgi:hypothetical protein